MTAFRRQFYFALLFAWLLVPGLSWACSLEFTPGGPPGISDYIQGRILSGVVFSGTVRAVKKTDSRNDSYGAYEISFAPMRWLGGDQRALVIVRGSLTDPKGPVECFQQPDFLPKMGEQWLIVGQMLDGKVNPAFGLSQRLINGHLPVTVETELRKQRLTP